MPNTVLLSLMSNLRIHLYSMLVFCLTPNFGPFCLDSQSRINENEQGMNTSNEEWMVSMKGSNL